MRIYKFFNYNENKCFIYCEADLNNRMKKIIVFISLCFSLLGFSQEKDLALQESNNLVYEGNALISENEFVSAEMEYRKAISKKSNNAVASYDLGNAYYQNERFEEALLRHTEAVEFAKTKEQKHSAWHNIGNTLMKREKCQEAVEAYKNALRNNPSDDETRYNFGLAKECAKKQQEEDEDKKNDEKEDEDKDKKEKDEEGEKEKDKKEEKDDQENKDEQKPEDGDDKKDENGDPKDEKKDQNKEGEQDNKPKKPQQQPGKLSPQQIKNLLEAMNNQEQKVQEKINAKKTKGVKVRTEKDW